MIWYGDVMWDELIQRHAYNNNESWIILYACQVRRCGVNYSERQKDKNLFIQINKQTDRQTDRQTNRQMDGQIDTNHSLVWNTILNNIVNRIQ